MPAENGLPQYVSRRGRNGPYQYYRRPPTGVVGAAFVRSFRTKDRKVMLAKYAAIHAEAEVYFERLISGRRLSDEELIRLVGTRQNAAALFKARPGELYQRSDWDRFIDQSGTPEMRALVGPDREFLVEHLYYLYVMTEAANAELTWERYEERREHLTRLTGSETVPLGSGLTLMDAYEQAWVPAATRSKNTARDQRISALRKDRVSDRAEVPEPDRPWSAYSALEAYFFGSVGIPLGMPVDPYPWACPSLIDSGPASAARFAVRTTVRSGSPCCGPAEPWSTARRAHS
jgi:hypothetical protein